MKKNILIFEVADMMLLNYFKREVLRNNMKEDRIIYSGHFSNIGWTSQRKNADILWFEGERLEALKIQCNVCHCVFEVLNNSDGRWACSNEAGILGITGKKIPIYAVKFNSNEGFDIYYRVCLSDIGWSSFYSNGQICGNDRCETGGYIQGIQIFLKRKEESLERCIVEAESKLRRYEKMRKALFVEDADKMLMACTKDYHFSKEIGVQEIKNGYILPLRKLNITALDGMFAGGVCNEQGEFITGHDRQSGNRFNLSCLEAYKVLENEVIFRDESVIFGGIYMKPFGHLFTECLSRLWYVIENSEDTDKIVILTLPGQEKFAYDFFTILGIEDTRITLITQPTKFKAVKVPDATIRLWGDYCDKYISIYDKMRENVKPMPHKKIFLTRTAYNRKDSVNEEWFDSFFEKHGYKVIAPEQYKIEEQIAMLAGADEVICTEGTLSHLVLFVKPSAKFVILRRDHKNILLPQYILDQARQVDVTYVDISYNLLPTKHTNGCFLYGPTKHFINFLKATGIEYTEEEIQFDISKHLYEYIQLWCNNFNIKRHFNLISDIDLFDVIERMNRVFDIPQIRRSDYITRVKARERELIQLNEKLAEENRSLKEENKRLTEIINSSSAIDQ